MRERKNFLLAIIIVAALLPFAGLVLGSFVARIIAPKPEYAVAFATAVAEEIHNTTKLPVGVSQLELTAQALRERLELSDGSTDPKYAPNNNIAVFRFVRERSIAVEVSVLHGQELAVTILQRPMPIHQRSWSLRHNFLKIFGKLPAGETHAIATFWVQLPDLKLQNLNPNATAYPTLNTFNNGMKLMFSPWEVTLHFNDARYLRWLKHELNWTYYMLAYGSTCVSALFAFLIIIVAGSNLRREYRKFRRGVEQELRQTRPSLLFLRFCLGNPAQLQEQIRNTAAEIQALKARNFDTQRAHRLLDNRLLELGRYFDDSSLEFQLVLAATTDSNAPLEEKQRLRDRLREQVEAKFREHSPAPKRTYTPREQPPPRSPYPNPLAEPVRTFATTLYVTLDDVIDVDFGEEEVYSFLPYNVDHLVARLILVSLIRGKRISPRYISYSDLYKQTRNAHKRGVRCNERDFRKTLGWLESEGVVTSLPKGAEHTYALSRQPSDGRTPESEELIRLAVRLCMTLLEIQIAS